MWEGRGWHYTHHHQRFPRQKQDDWVSRSRARTLPTRCPGVADGFDIRIREVFNTQHFAVLPFEPLVFLGGNHNRAVIFIAFDDNRLRDSGVLTAPLKSADEKRSDNQPAPRLGRTGNTDKEKGGAEGDRHLYKLLLIVISTWAMEGP